MKYMRISSRIHSNQSNQRTINRMLLYVICANFIFSDNFPPHTKWKLSQFFFRPKHFHRSPIEFSEMISCHHYMAGRIQQRQQLHRRHFHLCIVNMLPTQIGAQSQQERDPPDMRRTNQTKIMANLVDVHGTSSHRDNDLPIRQKLNEII